uniref:Putative 34 kDa secreted protein n=1 Tax=Psorophora albipes TaxID=869069 RepID=T1E2I2_9DIPT
MWFYSFVFAFLVLALAATVLSRPASEPSPNEGCSISEQDLNDLRSALRIAASANKNLAEHILTSESKQSLEACPMLANVVHSLRSVSSKLQNMKSRSADDGQIEVLRGEFEEKIGEIIKRRDIFERAAGQSATQQQGATVERITALQNEMNQLCADIEEQTRKL